LWLLRHAKTQEDPPPGGGDHERRLTSRGRRDAERLGRRLGPGGDRLGLVGARLPELVIASTAARTVQTAELVLASFDPAPPLHLTRAIYVASPEGVLDVLHDLGDGPSSVMVVGHNPTAQRLAGDLLDPADEAGYRQVEQLGFPTCALGVYAFAVSSWADVALGTATLVGLAVPPY
jgi:phosphohistidine phosphatase